MTRLFLTCTIQAQIQRVFDLSRSISLHVHSMKHTGEQAVSGVRTGLIGLNETVAWQAKHFGKTRLFTSIISQYNSPFSFTDEMQQGDFKSWKHIHHFEQKGNKTVLTDEVYYELPWRFAGKLANVLFLKKYDSAGC
jgi:hypothetical protein